MGAVLTTITPITDEDKAQLVLAGMEDAAQRLRMLGLSNVEAAQVMLEFGVGGMMLHGDYPQILEVVAKTVACALAELTARAPLMGPS